jgi:hypothetical protein
MSVGRKSAHERSLEELIEMKLDKVKIDEDLSYSDLVIEFSFQYDILFGEIKALVRSKSTNDILGVDIVDIVFPQKGHTFAPRVLKVGEGIEAWAALVGTGDVLFCRRFEDAMVPRKFPVCEFVLQPPIQQNILVCPVYLLRRCLEREGCTFGDGVVEAQGRFQWMCCGSPFRCSPQYCSKRNCWLHRLQYIRPLDTRIERWGLRLHWMRNKREVPYALNWGEGGAICFGICKSES